MFETMKRSQTKKKTNVGSAWTKPSSNVETITANKRRINIDVDVLSKTINIVFAHHCESMHLQELSGDSLFNFDKSQK